MCRNDREYPIEMLRLEWADGEACQTWIDSRRPVLVKSIAASANRSEKSFWTADHEYSIVRPQLLAYTT